MKRINYPLLIGFIIIAALFVISNFPETFTQSDPYGRQRLSYEPSENNQTTFVVPPLPPSKEYPWGTDKMGRDLRSLIIYGSKSTIILAVSIALVRLLISIPISIAAAYKNRFSNWIIKQFGIVFGAFPLVIVIMLISRIKLIREMSDNPMVPLGFILATLGFGRLAKLLKEKVTEILNEDFIEGEIALGKSKLEIAIQNIIPHLIPSITVLFFLEIAMVLLILSQLGVLGLALGGGYTDFDGNARIPLQFDWASLLIFAHYYFGTNKMWIIFYPALAFALSIIGFNLLGEGLRIEFDKRDSRVISFIRSIPSLISPLRYIYEIRNFKDRKKAVMWKTVILLTAVLFLLFSNTSSLFIFDQASAFATIKELSSEKYEGRLAGSKAHAQTAEYISNKLKEYGIQPYKESYFQEFNIERTINQNFSECIVNAPEGELTLEYRKDYQIDSRAIVNDSFDMLLVTLRDLNNNKNRDYINLKDKILVIDIRKLNDRNITSINGLLGYYVKPKGVIFINNWTSNTIPYKRLSRNRGLEDMITINISSDKGDELLKLLNGKISIHTEVDFINNTTGINIVGMIPGNDESLKNEYIIIGSAIDSVGDDKEVRYPGALEAGGIAIELEVAKTIAKNKLTPSRTILFAFWDGSQASNKGSSNFVATNINGSGKKVYYFDLLNFINKDTDKILVDTTKVIPTDVTGQSFVKILKKHGKRNNVDLIFGNSFASTSTDFVSTDKISINLDSYKINPYLMTPEDDIDSIDLSKLKKAGQMIMDTLIEITTGGTKK